MKIRQTQINNGTNENNKTLCIYFIVTDFKNDHHHQVSGNWGGWIRLLQLSVTCQRSIEWHISVPPMWLRYTSLHQRLNIPTTKTRPGQVPQFSVALCPTIVALTVATILATVRATQNTAKLENTHRVFRWSNLQPRLITRSTTKLSNKNALTLRAKCGVETSCMKVMTGNRCSGNAGTTWPRKSAALA